MIEVLYECNNCEAELWVLDTPSLEETIRCPECLDWAATPVLVTGLAK